MLDTSMLAFLAPCFAASLILAGIHAYLGVHVVERGVIFVDLSLAQIAALGATIALLMPFSNGDPHAPVVYWISLAFTFIGAFVFSTIRSKRARIPQEAIIGICYAVASAAAILAMSKATSESEHLKDMLVGNILAVSWPEVGKTAAALRRDRRCSTSSSASKFLAISMDHEKAEASGLNVQVLGLPVLRLVRLRRHLVGVDRRRAAGVLYLIVPSVAAMLYADTIGKRLAIGWTMGTIVSALGVYLSLKLDLPTGATIVCTFGLVLIIMAAVRPTHPAHMQCRNCGAEIADKALICYKCGTATTEAKYQPAPLPAASSRSGLVPTVIALALLVGVAFYLERGSTAASPQWVTYVAVAAAVIIIGIRAYARRVR